MTLLHLEGVTRTVEVPDGEPLTILNGVDLEVAEGDRLSIVGRSGSGKSTLLNLLGLLDAPTSGEVFFDGRALSIAAPRASATGCAAATSASSSSSSTCFPAAPRTRT